jgi:ribokinase
VATSPHDNQIIHIAGANSDVDVALAAEADLGPEDVCLAQMETPVPATAALFQRARANRARTILNAAPASTAARELLPLSDLLIVNESELALLAGSDVGSMLNDKGLLSSRSRLGLEPGQTLLITLGADGLAIVRQHTVQRIAGRPAKVIDTTGAGDCFCGYLAAGLARGDALERSAIEANAAGSIAVQSFGAAASIPDRATMLQSLGTLPAHTTKISLKEPDA